MAAASDSEESDGMTAALGIGASAATDGLDLAWSVLSPPSRSEQGCARARYAKLCQAKRQVPGHLRYLVRLYNTRQARRVNERIDLDESKWRKAPKGRFKQMLPSAIQRLCFGSTLEKVATPSRRQERRRRKTTVRNLHLKLERGDASSLFLRPPPFAVSTTQLAAREEAAAGHVQALRNAVAEIISSKQCAVVQGLPRADVAVLECALDETEFALSCPRRLTVRKKTLFMSTLRSVLVCHASLLWVVGAVASVTELCYPMRMLADTTAPCLYEAVREHMNIEALAAKATLLVFILVTDAAKSCRRLFRLLTATLSLRSNILMLHQFCLMHQLYLAINAAITPLDQLGRVFCASKMMRCGAVHDFLLKQLTHLVEKTLKRSFVPASVAVRKYNTSVVSILAHKGVLPTALADLVAMLSSSFSDECLVHFCPYGCCPNGRPESVRKVTEALVDGVYGLLPAVPALNRWTKLHPPIAWWAVALRVHGLIRVLWRTLPTISNEGLGADVSADMLYGLTGDKTQRLINLSRRNKTHMWLENPQSGDKLIVAALLLSIVIRIMGFLFVSGRLHTSYSILILCKARTAVHTCIDKLFTHIVMIGQDDFWLPLVGDGSELTEERMHLVWSTGLRLIGGMWQRLVWPFRHPPWLLAPCVDSDVDDAFRAARFDEARTLKSRACSACVDTYFTGKVFELCSDDLNELQPDGAMRKTTYQAFSRVKCTNILSEDRFGRAGAHMNSSSRGRRPTNATIASKHVLAEHLSQYNHTSLGVLKRKFLERGGMAQLASQTTLKGSVCNGWNVYLAEKRSRTPQLTMEAIAPMWHAESEAVRATYVAKSQELRECGVPDELIVSPSETPLEIGCHQYPVAADHLQCLTCSDTLHGLANKWKVCCNSIVTPSANALALETLADDGTLCGVRFGIGRCVKQYDIETLEWRGRHLSNLVHMSRNSRSGDRLTLLELRYDGSASSAEAVRPMYVLLLGALFRDPVALWFMRCAALPDITGDTFIELDNMLVGDGELATTMAEKKGEWSIVSWKYSLVAGARGAPAAMRLTEVVPESQATPKGVPRGHRQTR